jgi:hypothetical protein
VEAISPLSSTGVSSENPIAEHSERWRVLCWRLAQLSSAGYSDDAAAFLAAVPDVDLHQATELLRHGCAHDTALRILL